MNTTIRYDWERGPFQLIQTPLARAPEKKDDQFINVGTLMSLVHNIWMRGLNTVYLTAPKVPKSDYNNFVTYSWYLHEAIRQHHHEEELYVFPLLENATGAKGIMEGNVEQHEAFHTALTAWGSYLSDLIQRKDTASFSGTKFCKLIDAFREPLQIHFHDEIQSLLDLDKFPEVDFKKLGEKAHEEAMAHMAMTAFKDNLPMLMLNHDPTYEGGIHGMFPPLPGPMSFFIRRIATCWHWGWWKFASCDTAQMPKKLPYA